MKNNVKFFQIACLLLLVVIAVLFYKQQSEKKPISQTSSFVIQNEALSVIHNRKSVRNYIPDKPVSEEQIQAIVKAGMAAPSGRDLRPWEIVVVDQREILDSLAGALPYAKMLEHAPLAIIVCGDMTRSFYWYLDCSAVTQNILLAVESLGLGAVWTAAYPYEDRMDAVIKNIELPSNVLPLAVIPVGHPNGYFEPKDKYDENKIHRNKW